MKHLKHRFADRVGVATVMGFLTGVALTVWATFLVWLGHDPRSYSDKLAAWLLIAIVYLLGGTLAGLLIGLVGPVARTWWGAAALGFVIALGAYGAIELLPDPGGRAEPSPRIADVLILAALVGPAVGIGIKLVLSRTSDGRPP